MVAVGNATEEQMAIATTNDDAAKANSVRRQLSPSENPLELDVSCYFLSGHPQLDLLKLQVNILRHPNPMTLKP